MTLWDYRSKFDVDRIAPEDPTLYGWSIYPIRDVIIAQQPIATQRLYLARVVAPFSMRTTRIRMGTMNYSATGHTFSGYGIFSDDADGGATLLSKYEDAGSPPTTFIESANTNHTVTLTTPVDWVAGRTYWVGPLTVFTGGAINLPTKGEDVVPLRGEANLGTKGRQSLYITSLTSIPSAIAAATIAAATNALVIPYVRFVP